VLEHEEIVRLYGPWVRRTPDDAARLLEGYDGLWWIAGGWAIEAFTNIRRHHGDLDPSVPRGDVPRLRHHLAGRLDVWAADQGTLRPLPASFIHDEPRQACSNLWLRRSGADPWEFDFILMDVLEGTWTYKRDRRISKQVGDILWIRDGLRYLRPEVQLLHKAAGLRAVDQSDFDVCAPMLDSAARDWLSRSLSLAHPGHPWLASLNTLSR
jgi:hypothetical protein